MGRLNCPRISKGAQACAVTRPYYFWAYVDVSEYHKNDNDFLDEMVPCTYLFLLRYKSFDEFKFELKVKFS